MRVRETRLEASPGPSSVQWLTLSVPPSFSRSRLANSRTSSFSSLNFSVLQRQAQVARRARHVPAVLLERAHQQVALEGRHRVLEQALARARPSRSSSRHPELERQVVLGDPRLVGDRDEPLDQVLELADVAGPPVRRRACGAPPPRCPPPACGTWCCSAGGRSAPAPAGPRCARAAAAASPG